MASIHTYNPREIPRKENPIRKHPKKRHYSGSFVNWGKEAVIYRHKKKGVVRKYWRQAWILSHYKFYNSVGRLYKKAADRAGAGFRADHLGFALVQEGAYRLAIPSREFSKITFILSKASEDLLKRAREVAIPTPKIARAAHHPKFKENGLWILELSDLTKKGHVIMPGNELTSNRNIRKQIKNYDEIIAGIEEDLEKLKGLGFEQDLRNHTRYSAWLIRLNEKTRIAERFLWDASNLQMISKKRPRK